MEEYEELLERRRLPFRDLLHTQVLPFICFVLIIVVLVLLLNMRAAPKIVIPDPPPPPPPVVFPPFPDPISNYTGWVGDSNCAARLHVVNGSIMEDECVPYASMVFHMEGAINGPSDNTTLKPTNLNAGTYCEGSRGIQSLTTLDGGVLDNVTCKPLVLTDGIYCGPNQIVQSVTVEDNEITGFQCRSLVHSPIINDTGVESGCHDFLTHSICVLDDGRLSFISNVTEIYLLKNTSIITSNTIYGPVDAPEIIQVLDDFGCRTLGAYNVCVTQTGQIHVWEDTGNVVVYTNTPITLSTTITGTGGVPELKVITSAGSYGNGKLLDVTVDVFGRVVNVVEGPSALTEDTIFGGDATGRWNNLILTPTGVTPGCYSLLSHIVCISVGGRIDNITSTGLEYVEKNATVISNTLIGTPLQLDLTNLGTAGTYNSAGNRLLTHVLDDYGRTTSIIEGLTALVTTTVFNGDVTGLSTNMKIVNSGVTEGCYDFGTKIECVLADGRVKNITDTGVSYIPITQTITSSNTLTHTVAVPELKSIRTAANYGAGDRLWTSSVDQYGRLTVGANGKQALTVDTTFEGGGDFQGNWNNMQMISMGIGDGTIGSPTCIPRFGYDDKGRLTTTPVCQTISYAGLTNDTLVLLGTARRINIYETGVENTYQFDTPQDLDFLANVKFRSARFAHGAQEYRAPIEGVSIAGYQSRGSFLRFYTNHSSVPASEIRAFSPSKTRWAWNMFTDYNGTRHGSLSVAARFVEMSNGLFAVGGTSTVGAPETIYSESDFVHRFTVDDAQTSVLQRLRVKDEIPTLALELDAETSPHLNLGSSSRSNGWLLFGLSRTSGGAYLAESTGNGFEVLHDDDEVSIRATPAGNAIGATVIPTKIIRYRLSGTTISTPLSVESTLNVVGASTLGSTLSVGGAASFSSILSVSGPATFSNSLFVSGTTTLNGPLLARAGFVAGNPPQSAPESSAKYVIVSTDAAEAALEFHKSSLSTPGLVVGLAPDSEGVVNFGTYYLGGSYRGKDTNAVYQMKREGTGTLQVLSGVPTAAGLAGTVSLSTIVTFSHDDGLILDKPLAVASGGTGSNAVLTGEKIMISKSSQLVVESNYSLQDLLQSIANLSISMTGTTNRISITSSGSGAYIFSTPQDIDANADVEFNSVNVNTVEITGTEPTLSFQAGSDACPSKFDTVRNGKHYLVFDGSLDSASALRSGPDAVPPMGIIKESNSFSIFVDGAASGFPLPCSSTSTVHNLIHLEKASTGETEALLDANVVRLRERVVIGDQGMLTDSGYRKFTLYGDGTTLDAPVIQFHDISDASGHASMQLGKVAPDKLVHTFGGYFDGTNFVSNVGTGSYPMHWAYEGNDIRLAMGDGTASAGTAYNGTSILTLGPDYHEITGDLTVMQLPWRTDFPSSIRAREVSPLYSRDDYIDVSMGTWADGTTFVAHGIKMFANKTGERQTSFDGWLWQTVTDGRYVLTQYANTEGSQLDIRNRIEFDWDETLLKGNRLAMYGTLDITDDPEPTLSMPWDRSVRLDRRVNIGTSADGNGWLLFSAELTEGGSYRGRSMTNGFGIRHSSNQLDLLVTSVPSAIGLTVTPTTLLRLTPTGTTSFLPLTVSQTLTASTLLLASSFRAGPMPTTMDTTGRFAIGNTGGTPENEYVLLEFFRGTSPRPHLQIGTTPSGLPTVNFGTYYANNNYRSIDSNPGYTLHRSSNGNLRIAGGQPTAAGMAGSLTPANLVDFTTTNSIFYNSIRVQGTTAYAEFYPSSATRPGLVIGSTSATSPYINFGTYFDGSTYRASDNTGPAYQIVRIDGDLWIRGAPGPASAGAAISLDMIAHFCVEDGLVLAKPLAVAYGGTGSNAPLTSGRIMVSSGQSIVASSARAPVNTGWQSARSTDQNIGFIFNVFAARSGDVCHLFLNTLQSATTFSIITMSYVLPTTYRPSTYLCDYTNNNDDGTMKIIGLCATSAGLVRLAFPSTSATTFDIDHISLTYPCTS